VGATKLRSSKLGTQIQLVIDKTGASEPSSDWISA
jgi:hypothetical protein